MKRIALASLALIALCASAFAQSWIIPGTQVTIPITISTATTTLLVTGVSNKAIYVTNVNVVAAGTGNIQFITGTGATCGTGTANVSGNYQLTAQVGFVAGTGNGAIWALPVGNNLCAVTSAAVGMPGSLSYALF